MAIHEKYPQYHPDFNFKDPVFIGVPDTGILVGGMVDRRDMDYTANFPATKLDDVLSHISHIPSVELCEYTVNENTVYMKLRGSLHACLAVFNKKYRAPRYNVYFTEL
jgi:hypothetical protein